jgi:predicted PurR-regulated permease PerM
MNDSTQRTSLARGLLAAASFMIVVAGLRAASSVILPFLLSLLLAMASYPLLAWLRRMKVPTGLAVAITLLTVLVVIGAVGVLVGTSVHDFTMAAPRYKASLAELVGDSRARLQTLGLDLPETWSLSGFDPGKALDLATTLLRAMSAALGNMFLVLLTIGFLLVEAAGLPAKLAAALGNDLDTRQMERTRVQVQSYLAIKTLMSALTGALIAIVLALMGVDFPLLWGALAFLLNFIPTIGSIIAAVPPILLTLVQLDVWYALGVAILFLSVNMVIGNILEPTITGKQLGLSPLVVFVSLLFWGWVWGPVGMFLSVPLTMIIKIFLENSPNLQWVAILLDASPPERPAAAAATDSN